MLAISFCGPMTPAAVKPLKAACCNAVNKQAAELTLLFGSAGGSIDVAFDLYHFLKALPLRLTIHNTGMVGSMATLVFLAGQVRRTAEQAVFLFHDMSWTYGEPQTVAATTLGEQALLLESARSRMKQVFRSHTALDEERLERLHFMREPVILDARAALDAGIVQEICDPKLRYGTELYAAEWP
ncbi:ATP-dependent Clp protease proteolytic subunit [Arenibaculum pallidiluteum]|uniref:ATP-dependent Clp protease proteolytic subunit n=1 Tax=Arenibaculum pallidiluteum TaxID=2812559 RepID=UPI001A96F818|nr:ATP-dependent Clp protease proteolytic subunit [Arenibaculum pallidiluteum]